MSWGGSAPCLFLSQFHCHVARSGRSSGRRTMGHRTARSRRRSGRRSSCPGRTRALWISWRSWRGLAVGRTWAVHWVLLLVPTSTTSILFICNYICSIYIYTVIYIYIYIRVYIILYYRGGEMKMRMWIFVRFVNIKLLRLSNNATDNIVRPV